MPVISRPLTVDNKLAGLPAIESLTGQSVIDTSKLDDRTGMLTSDPGFKSTAATEAKIAHIDGGKGILLSRGGPITQLRKHGDFLEKSEARFRTLANVIPTIVWTAAPDGTIPSSTITDTAPVASRQNRMSTGGPVSAPRGRAGPQGLRNNAAGASAQSPARR